MIKYSTHILLTITITLFSTTTFSQNKTDQSKQELKQGAPSDNNPKPHEYSGSNNDNDSFSEDNPLTNLAAQLIAYVTYYALVGNYNEEEQLSYSVSKYPYRENYLHGNYSSSDSNSINILRVDFENSVMFNDNNLFGNHLKLKIRPFHYFYLQTDYIEIIEQNDLNTYSNLSLFKFNFCYDRIRYQKFNLGWVMGANYIASGVGLGGFNFGLNTDIFITKNISLYSAVNWCKVNEVPVNEFEIYGKYHSGRFFTSLGYDFIKIGTPEYHYATLGFGVYL